jgi:general secretion pathway protein J
MIPRSSRAAQISSRSRETGFTLLELLVSLSVLGLVLIALNQGVQTALGMWGVQSRQIIKTKDLDATARILRTVLMQIPVSASASINPGSPPVAIAFTGNADELKFVGNLPTGLGTDSYADITLGLSGKRLVLHWLPHRHELGGPAPAANVTEILQGVERLDLAYWGPREPSAPATWLAGWDGPSLPNLLRVRLGFAAGDLRQWPDLIIAPRL